MRAARVGWWMRPAFDWLEIATMKRSVATARGSVTFVNTLSAIPVLAMSDKPQSDKMSDKLQFVV